MFLDDEDESLRSPRSRRGSPPSRIITYPSDKPCTASLESSPITKTRRPRIPSVDHRLHDLGTARANYAPTIETPYGTIWWTDRHKNKTVIEQHVAYWDRDDDGVIWPLDTYRGCRDFGWGIILSALAAFLINVNFSYATQKSLLPDPHFRIYTKRLYKDKHGSNSMTYDNEGRFRPQQFEDFFSKYDRNKQGGLDVWDLLAALNGQRLTMDVFGWTATFLEWFATYLLIWPEDGILRKEDIRGVFDGSMFQRKADIYQAKLRRKHMRLKSIDDDEPQYPRHDFGSPVRLPIKNGI